MKTEELQYITEQLEHIAKVNPKGFSYDFKNETFVKRGFIAAYEATQNTFNTYNLESVILHADKHEGIVGGWLNEEDGKYYFDSCKVFKDVNKALNFGMDNNQIAIFDINQGKEIRLKD